MRTYVNLLQRFLRNYSTSIKTELQLPTFCNINVDLPNAVKISPLDVYQYQDCDKLILDVQGSDKDLVKCVVEGSDVKIFNTENITSPVDIIAPMKSNLQVTSTKDILVGAFNGDSVGLKTENGNVTVAQYNGASINILNKRGNITLNGPVQSSSFVAKILDSGSISTGKLQCLKVFLSTNEGIITVPSSYSDESHFEVDKGKLELQNIHKLCQIGLDVGELNLSGFDGVLNANLGNVQANIQLSRIHNDSTIKIQNNGKLRLKISEEIQASCILEINAKHTYIDESLKDVQKDKNVYTFSKYVNKSKPRILIDCGKSDVSISSASWKDMLKQKQTSL